MEHLPSGANANGTQFTVADFLREGRERLQLTLVTGEKGLLRTVDEPIVNRPGLALTGFYEHFAWNRLQLIGNAETAYLQSLDRVSRLERFRALVERQAFCFIHTCGHQPDPDILRLADETGVVLLTTPLPTATFAHHSTFVLERLGAPKTTLYGTMVEVCGLGVLFEGAPGLGKSETALGLVKRGCALVADDLTCIRKDVGNNLLFGSASASTAGYMELRGIGIMHIPSIFGVTSVRGEKRLQLVITFKPIEEVKGELDRTGQTRHYKTILGVDVPNMIIPVSEGRDLVNLVETAAMQQKIIMAGIDPAENLAERLRQRMDKQQKTTI